MGMIREMMEKYNLSAVKIPHNIRKKVYTGVYTILKSYCYKLRKDRGLKAVYRYGIDRSKRIRVDFGEFGRIDHDGSQRNSMHFP